MRIRGLCKLPDRGTGCVATWVLFWWARPCSFPCKSGTFICYSILLPSGELFTVCRKVKMCLSSFLLSILHPWNFGLLYFFVYFGIKIISDLVQSNFKCDMPVFCIDNIICVCPNLHRRRRHFFLCVFQSPVYILDTYINNLYLYMYFWCLFVCFLLGKKWIYLERNTPYRVWAIWEGERGLYIFYLHHSHVILSLWPMYNFYRRVTFFFCPFLRHVDLSSPTRNQTGAHCSGHTAS